jgi:hypothetical protein
MNIANIDYLSTFYPFFESVKENVDALFLN